MKRHHRLINTLAKRSIHVRHVEGKAIPRARAYLSRGRFHLGCCHVALGDLLRVPVRSIPTSKLPPTWFPDGSVLPYPVFLLTHSFPPDRFS